MTGSTPRRALVTGAASGIGRATAALLVRRGWRVALVDIDDAAIDAQAIDWGHQACACPCDLSDVASISAALASVEKAVGHLDLLVNSAGLLFSGNFEEQPVAAIQRLLAVNNAGLAICTRMAFPLLCRAVGLNGKATVVNLSSASAAFGIPSLAVYSASKFWVRGFTEALAVEWARHGIAVRDVMPPFVKTSMVLDGARDNPFYKKMRAQTTAEQVAEQVWRAYHGGPLHRVMSVRLRMEMIASRLLPLVLLRHRLAAIGGYPRRRPHT